MHKAYDGATSRFRECIKARRLDFDREDATSLGYDYCSFGFSEQHIGSVEAIRDIARHAFALAPIEVSASARLETAASTSA